MHLFHRALPAYCAFSCCHGNKHISCIQHRASTLAILYTRAGSGANYFPSCICNGARQCGQCEDTDVHRWQKAVLETLYTVVFSFLNTKQLKTIICFYLEGRISLGMETLRLSLTCVLTALPSHSPLSAFTCTSVYHLWSGGLTQLCLCTYPWETLIC